MAARTIYSVFRCELNLYDVISFNLEMVNLFNVLLTVHRDISL